MMKAGLKRADHADRYLLLLRACSNNVVCNLYLIDLHTRTMIVFGQYAAPRAFRITDANRRLALWRLIGSIHIQFHAQWPINSRLNSSSKNKKARNNNDRKKGKNQGDRGCIHVYLFPYVLQK